MTDWVRLWHDMPTDPKWRTIARKSGQPLPCVIALFTLYMTTASAADERGTITSLSIEDAAAALDMDEEDVQAIRDAMEGRVIENDRLSGWERRQPKRERENESPSTSRVQAHRERQKAQKNANNNNETPRNTKKRTDTDTDTDYLETNVSCASGEAREPENQEFQLEAEQQKVERLKPEHFVEVWNDLADRIAKPKIRSLTPERRERLKARIAGYSLDEFREVLGNIETSSFLRGDKGWNGCTFDWVTKKANFQKILEGNYNA